MTEDELDACLALLHRGIQRVITAPQTVLLERGLGRAHHRTMFYIRREPGIAVGDLAARAAVTGQALHKTLRDLIGQGLVLSKPNPKNRRSRQLSLTPAGRRLEAKLSGIQRGLFAVASQAVGKDKMLRWVEVARALAEA